jgi:hypothetical protein
MIAVRGRAEAVEEIFGFGRWDFLRRREGGEGV